MSCKFKEGYGKYLIRLRITYSGDNIIFCHYICVLHLIKYLVFFSVRSLRSLLFAVGILGYQERLYLVCVANYECISPSFRSNLRCSFNCDILVKAHYMVHNSILQSEDILCLLQHHHRLLK